MIITKEAIEFLYRIFFSCYMEGAKNSESNKALIKKNLIRKKDLDFDQFCKGLLGWDQRKAAIEKNANDLKKRFIDKEVVACYFGGPLHTLINANELREERFPIDGRFYNYSIFNHTLVPLEVKIVHNENVLVGIYRNDNVSFGVIGVLFFAKHKARIKAGQTVLVHFPLVIEPEPSQSMIDMLLRMQKNDLDFMRAAEYFSGKNVNHLDFQYFSMLKKRM